MRTSKTYFAEQRLDVRYIMHTFDQTSIQTLVSKMLLLSQQAAKCWRFCLRYQLLSCILLDLFISLQCFDINSPNVRNGQIFSRFKCQSNDVIMCALDLPNQTISFVTREYCLSICHTGFRWSWFNHIADEDLTRCMMGECQLYAQQPQNIGQKARCSLYKVGGNVMASMKCLLFSNAHWKLTNKTQIVGGLLILSLS
jgi:hypothetical protein